MVHHSKAKYIHKWEKKPHTPADWFCCSLIGTRIYFRKGIAVSRTFSHMCLFQFVHS